MPTENFRQILVNLNKEIRIKRFDVITPSGFSTLWVEIELEGEEKLDKICIGTDWDLLCLGQDFGIAGIAFYHFARLWRKFANYSVFANVEEYTDDYIKLENFFGDSLVPFFNDFSEAIL